MWSSDSDPDGSVEASKGNLSTTAHGLRKLAAWLSLEGGALDRGHEARAVYSGALGGSMALQRPARQAAGRKVTARSAIGSSGRMAASSTWLVRLTERTDSLASHAPRTSSWGSHAVDGHGAVAPDTTSSGPTRFGRWAIGIPCPL